MMYPLPQTDVVLSALASGASLPQQQLKGWERRVVRKQSDGRCAYCLTPLDPLLPRKAHVNALIPVVLGGPAIRENRVLCCAACARNKANNDVVGWPALVSMAPAHRAQLLDARTRVLLLARNHLTPHAPSVSLPVLLDHLAARFEHPRFRVFAAQGLDRGWIGWTPECGSDTARTMAAGLLRWANRSRVLSRDNLTLFEVAGDAFLDTIWQLIEHNALVVPLPLDNLPPPSKISNDWRHCWMRTFHTPSDLRRRHSRLDTSVAPSPPPLRSTSPGAVWKRNLDATRKRENQSREWNRAQLSLDRIAQDYKSGQLLNMDASDMWELSGEVLRLKAQAMGLALG